MVAFDLGESSDLKNEVYMNNTYKTWVSLSQRSLISIIITSIGRFSLFSEVILFCSEKHTKREDLINPVFMRLEFLIAETGATCKYDSAVKSYK
jgi:hypothetical protein